MCYAHCVSFYAAVFNKIIDGKYFYLQNDTYTELFLALSKDERFSVKGMVSFHSTMPCVYTNPRGSDKR